MNGFSRKRLLLARGAVPLALTLCLAGTAAGGEAKLPLSLKEAIRFAAERNLDVKAELYNPALSEADIRKNRAIYDPNLTADLSYTESAQTNSTEFSANVTRTKNTNLTAGITQLVPWGGTIGLNLDNSWDSNNYTNSLDSYFSNIATATYTQPLLKNFGREATELNITLAAYAKEASLDQFLTRLTGTIAQVRTEYFNLYYLREDLEVKKSSLALAQKILDETRARVKAGVLPAMEILNAEFNVSTREKQLIDADRSFRDKSDLLRTLLQITEAGDLDPLDPPADAPCPLSEAGSVKQAMTRRPELKQLRETLRSAELQEKVSRTRVMPDLSLNLTGGLAGIGKNYTKQWEVLARGDYPLWKVGFTVSYPLGNNAAENDYIRNRLRSEQLRTQIRSQEETIANEVRTAIRGVEAGYKQLEVTRQGAAYAEEVLNAYIKKAQVGLATTKDVFDVQNNLVIAKGAQIQAKVTYDAALTQYWKATGEILDREGVRIIGSEADELYRKMQ